MALGVKGRGGKGGRYCWVGHTLLLAWMGRGGDVGWLSVQR